MKEKVARDKLATALRDSASMMKKLAQEVEALREERDVLKEKLADLKGTFAIEKVLAAMESQNIFPDDMSAVERRRLIRDNFSEYQGYLKRPVSNVRLSSTEAPVVNREKQLLEELAND